MKLILIPDNTLLEVLHVYMPIRIKNLRKWNFSIYKPYQCRKISYSFSRQLRSVKCFNALCNDWIRFNDYMNEVLNDLNTGDSLNVDIQIQSEYVIKSIEDEVPRLNLITENSNKQKIMIFCSVCEMTDKWYRTSLEKIQRIIKTLYLLSEIALQNSPRRGIRRISSGIPLKMLKSNI